MAAIRYILLNPVKAGIIKNAWEYKWSSAKDHMKIAGNNTLLKDNLLKEIIRDWEEFLDVEPSDNDVRLLQLHERTGRPLGNNTFIEQLEHLLKISLERKRAGRKKKEK